MPNFPYGATVTLIRRTVSGRDEYGNDEYTETPVTIPGCVLSPGGSNEEVQFTDQVSTDLTVFFPKGTEVSPVDALEVSGSRYEIQGDLSSWTSPFSGVSSPIQVRATRITGASG